nr:copper resistance protein CopC [Ammoniphilus resinae]
MEKAYPGPDSQLSASPSEITLTFNERLERELYYIQVFDGHGVSVTENLTEMSRDQRELVLPLPPLKDDHYTVTYRVISADGHTIRGTYVMNVGEIAPVATTGLVEIYKDASVRAAVFGVRIFYFLLLLFLTGLILWGTYFSFRSREFSDEYKKETKDAQVLFLVALFVLTFVQMGEVLTDWKFAGMVDFLFKTMTGGSLIFSLALSLAGFAVLHRRWWIDGGWALSLLFAKSLNGHAVGFDPPFLTIPLNFIHLLSAALWVGGLFYLLLFWKGHQEQVVGFLPVFSRTAVVSIVVLTLTGSLSSIIYLPKLSYLVETLWGILLLVKLALVGFVIVVGAIIRQRMKKNLVDQLQTWIKVDLCLMILIVGIVGVFTYLSPSPSNKPLYWEERIEVARITTQITPNAPGVNQFRVNISINKKEVKMKDVTMFLSYLENPQIAPIEVPFSSEQLIAGRDEYELNSVGAYLPFAGRWMVEVRIMDGEDNETVSKKEFTIY